MEKPSDGTAESAERWANQMYSPVVVLMDRSESMSLEDRDGILVEPDPGEHLLMADAAAGILVRDLHQLADGPLAIAGFAIDPTRATEAKDGQYVFVNGRFVRDRMLAHALREAYREDGKVKKRTLANISCLSAEVIEGLKVLLKGGVAVPSAEEVFTVERRNVKVGPLSLNRVMVTDGLAKGDRIALAGVHILREGTRVRLLAEPAMAAP